jgi:hypothetical protein
MFTPNHIAISLAVVLSYLGAFWLGRLWDTLRLIGKLRGGRK